MLDGNDILALDWPAGKVIGLALDAAGTLEGRGLSRGETSPSSATCTTTRRSPRPSVGERT